ncbi:tRNA pseudouridine synthase A [Bacteroidia bacterium]|nr:tRNA pseudouridine synthase A [Bacteroidia bacterium]GHV43743.1 tRNA pseudouridine synthase A [Bacteroidia bacterium]
MFRYFIYLSYNGTAYCGWQVQPNGVAVQEILTYALQTVLRTPELEIVGAGRTDAGVHAKEMVAHFDWHNVHIPLCTLFAGDSANREGGALLCKKLNSFLPRDIAVEKIIPVRNDAHARFSAIERTYEYHIITKKNVFKNNFAAKIETPLDFQKMNEAAALLTEYQDFTSFSKLHTDTKTNNCKITFAQWQQIDACEWIFRITANRFLRNMVRAIVGTLLETGKGKMSVDDFRQIIEQKNRALAGTSAPAEGLFLTKIAYDRDIFITENFCQI